MQSRNISVSPGPSRFEPYQPPVGTGEFAHRPIKTSSESTIGLVGFRFANGGFGYFPPLLSPNDTSAF